MPDRAGNRTTFARFCLAIALAAMLPGHLAEAASNAQSWPEQDGAVPQRIYSPLNGDVTLTGFHCDAISIPSSSAFDDDLDYRDTPFTVGVEVFLEEVSALQSSAAPPKMDDATGAEARTPLSAKVSRMLTRQEMSLPAGAGEMEDVFVPEASMAVAELVALCTP